MANQFWGYYTADKNGPAAPTTTDSPTTNFNYGIKPYNPPPIFLNGGGAYNPANADAFYANFNTQQTSKPLDFLTQTLAQSYGFLSSAFQSQQSFLSPIFSSVISGSTNVQQTLANAEAQTATQLASNANSGSGLLGSIFGGLF